MLHCGHLIGGMLPCLIQLLIRIGFGIQLGKMLLLPQVVFLKSTIFSCTLELFSCTLELINPFAHDGYRLIISFAQGVVFGKSMSLVVLICVCFQCDNMTRA